MRVLVTAASKHGATTEIAAVVADVRSWASGIARRLLEAGDAS